jgi:hypothetical protein
MQFNDIKILLEDYHAALLSSSNDEQWLINSFKYPEIYASYFETQRNIDIVSNNLLVEDLIKYKNKNNLKYIPEKVVEFNKNAIEYIKSNIDETYQQTSYYASIVAKLINEYSYNRRKFGSYRITPSPEKIDDTYLPVKKFSILCKNGKCKATIVRGGIKIDNDEDMTDYFQKRMISKFIKTGYTDEIPNEKYHSRRLVFLKSLPLNTIKVLSKTPKKYKLRYLGNQTVGDDENEFSITNEPIFVTHIGKS